MSCGLGRVAVNVAVGDFRLWLQLAAVVVVVILEKKKQVLGTQQHEGWSLMCIVFRTTTLYMSLVGCAGVCSVGFGSATIFGHVRESQIRQISFEVLCVTVKTLIFACPKRVFFWSRRCAHFWPATFFGINFFCNMTLKTFNENINFFEKYKN